MIGRPDGRVLGTPSAARQQGCLWASSPTLQSLECSSPATRAHATQSPAVSRAAALIDMDREQYRAQPPRLRSLQTLSASPRSRWHLQAPLHFSHLQREDLWPVGATSDPQPEAQDRRKVRARSTPSPNRHVRTRGAASSAHPPRNSAYLLTRQ